MYDVIVVGARCAGSPTAMLLAREGFKVLLLDRAAFPSDSPVSTHLVHPPGIRRLRDWGLLDELHASGCPPIREYGLKTGSVDLMAPLPPDEDVDLAYAPRRVVLDQILVNAAVQAGAELRENVSVQELVTDQHGTVIGVRGQARDGGPFTEHARLVIGADGTRSKVARLVDAPIYNTRPALLSSWWTYWDGLPVDNVPTWRDNHRYAFAWPTNDGLTLVGVAWRTDVFKRLAGDPSASYFSALGEVAPEFVERVRASTQAERWLTGSVPNFFRRSSGPGWALVGDASYSRDPCTASGITEAFRGAEYLAEAVRDGLSGRRQLAEALVAYERRRNTTSLPYYEYTCDFAALRPYPADVVAIIEAATRSPKHASDLVGLFGQTASPVDFFGSANMRELLADSARGPAEPWRLSVLRWMLARRLDPLTNRLIANRLGELGPFLKTVWGSGRLPEASLTPPG
ncbi:NAD(P)/FAD-dependent oxidoreductase [Micromonospora tarensis]|uniref:NAD(P)/FAD-dependent oxidoreductase n=1 Tax=Micromonospora tarensis TaxID=2806100 RepID=A0ABS1YEQ0_9ACTN|nr:NAD(P)/FAD-dependent oxidoreductase [Micromonospora tarensis]MBM0275899.1 NAD(P)/FAD-dependent oxidoreductase [Micromonospora tarensis]